MQMFSNCDFKKEKTKQQNSITKLFYTWICHSLSNNVNSQNTPCVIHCGNPSLSLFLYTMNEKVNTESEHLKTE